MTIDPGDTSGAAEASNTVSAQSSPADSAKIESSDELGKTALEQTSDFVKVSSGLATGSLVFSVGILTQTVSIPALGRTFLLIAWALLAISIFFAFLTAMTIPPKFAYGDYSLEDPWMNRPAMIHQLTFLGGIALLASALFTIAYSEPAYDQDRILTAGDAVTLLRAKLGTQLPQSQISTAEAIRGAETGKPSEVTWHFRVLVSQPSGARVRRIAASRGVPASPIPSPTARTVDYFINSASGDVKSIP